MATFLRVMNICLFSLLAVVAHANQPSKRPPPTVEIQAVGQQTLAQQLSALAVLKAQESIMLKPEVAGRVTAINFNEGQVVKEKQLLIQLDDDLLKAELATYQASLDLAQTEYQRYQALVKEQQVSVLDYERKKAELAQIKASMALVQAKIRQKQIRAPFTGVIGLRQFSIGDVLQANQNLVRLNKMNALKAEIKIPETHSQSVFVKQTVNLQVDGLANLVLKGQVAAIEPSLDANTRALIVRVNIPQVDSRVRDGMTARASFVLGQQQAIIVPEQALVAQGGKFVVFVFNNNEVKATPVEVGQRQVGQVVINKGLQVGDRVVVSGQNKLSKPQMPVKAIPVQ
ncbi:efflux RND transporter periplasmic adaptor subunit [uncultured Agitococcus sp.]|uniref:efflux RND transporter periplasmic adaptor subunit n=1 Tax=uncultured Agitococcus sp. TaxID=1506599 RepID=UPI0026207D2F|nr:efflux RND transporter periplasmic adaptor subunit [uncultured Agitococcus sp.]